MKFIKEKLIKDGFLTFKKKKNGIYDIINSKGQLLGYISQKRIGKHMLWCFFPDAIDSTGDMWFTNGCMKEISKFITSLS